MLDSDCGGPQALGGLIVSTLRRFTLPLLRAALAGKVLLGSRGVLRTSRTG